MSEYDYYTLVFKKTSQYVNLSDLHNTKGFFFSTDKRSDCNIGCLE